MITSIERLQLSKYKCLKSLEFFTRYFFKEYQKKKFILNHHHRTITTALQKVAQGKTKRLIINIAPRYGKTELAVKNFIAWSLANNPKAKFIHLSYADDLALDNSEAIRDLILSAEYQQFFPTTIKKDSNSKKKWYTEQGGGLYATSSGGQVTGFGAGSVEPTKGVENFGGAIIIDDPIKPDDAESDTVRERVNAKFDSTIRNRVNSRDTPIIIIMQRLHPNDLCGYLTEHEKDWELISLPCIYKDGKEEKALWPFKHTLPELKEMRAQNTVNFERQYMQDPKPRQGLMYNQFLTYNERPKFDGKTMTLAYIDTADTGSDYLCSIVYQVKDQLIYILDVVYTQDPMEVTERLVVKQFEQFNVNLANVESNNGGRGFARNVERIARDQRTMTVIKWFHQSQNKDARIFSNSANIEHYVRYPSDWAARFPEFYKAITRYMAKGKNKHDDAPDALTGCFEMSFKRNTNKPKFE